VGMLEWSGGEVGAEVADGIEDEIYVGIGMV
jgi:hypothetical protein